MDSQTQKDLFFLPVLIKETIFVLDKEEKILSTQNETTIMPALPFLVLHEEASPLAESLNEQLNNILKAIHISLHQVEKLSVAAFQPTMLQDRAFVFIFSNDVPEPFISLEKNKVRALTQSTKALLSDTLSELINDKQKKMTLWNELKKTFQP